MCIDCGRRKRRDSGRCRSCQKAWRLALVCEVCGESLAQRRARKFCSLRCSEVSSGRRLPEPYPARMCAYPPCGVEFVPGSKVQKCCCEDHGRKLSHARGMTADGRPYSKGTLEARRRRSRRKTQWRRAVVWDESAERVDRDEVGDRDGWVCGVCEEPVDRTLEYPDLLSPSLDHVVPLSRLGPHTYENCQISHLLCNMDKRDREGYSLVLSG
jgi:hypothetical protein